MQASHRALPAWFRRPPGSRRLPVQSSAGRPTPLAARIAAPLAALMALAACGSAPPANISLSKQVAPVADTPALAVEPVKWERSRPGCTADCPTIQVDSVAFPQEPRLSALVDHALATMTGFGPDSQQRSYIDLAGFEPYYWKTAQAGYQVVLKAAVLRQTGNLVVLQLDSYQFTGGAHGIPATQYLNWQRSPDRVLSLADVLVPGQRPAFMQALRSAHAAWLRGNPDAQDDPARYDKMWPFQESENYALVADGVRVKYDAYSIAPYSHGQPELTIAYSALRGILKPEYLP